MRIGIRCCQGGNGNDTELMGIEGNVNGKFFPTGVPKLATSTDELV